MMLILLLVPALLAYLRTEYVEKDMFRTRKNACTVLKEYVTMASMADTSLDHTETLYALLQKCTKDKSTKVADVTKQSLLILHEALSRKTPPLTRPVDDPEDTCNIPAWTDETSFIRELFGTQLDHPATGISHPLVMDCTQGLSVHQCLLSIHARVRRAPLVMMCLVGPKVTVSLDVPFGGVKYTLQILANDSYTYKKDQHAWTKVTSHSNRSPIDISELKTSLTLKTSSQVAVYIRT